MADRIGMALRLAKEGRTEGFQYLYEYTVEKQLGKAIALMGDIGQAQSVVQQAYQYIFDQIAQVPQSDVFENWLSEMIPYYAVMTVREIQPDAFAGSEDQTYRLEDDDMAITEPLEDSLVSAVYTSDEIEAMTTQILSELTEAEKICVIMHYQENQPVAQVAKTVGCTEQAAESLIASGKRKIQAAIGQLVEEDDRVRWNPISFLMVLLRLKATNLVTSGIAGTIATFQIAGSAVTFGTAAAGGVSGAAGMATGSSTSGAAGVTAGNEAAGITGGGTTIGSGTAAGSGTAIGHGFMHTLAAKIFIGVAAAAVIGGTAAGIIAYNHSHKKPADTTATSTDAQVASTAAETTEQTTTEEAATEEAVNEAYKPVYLQILQEHEANIKAYNQYRQTLGVDDFASDNENMSIALSDVTGDGVPELLFVEKSPSSEEYVEYDALNIFTVENGAAKQIYYADHWETQVAGGNVYSLFQVDGESTLYSCNGMQDESTFEDYCRYVVQPDGTLQEESLMSRKREPNEDYSGVVETCTVGGQSVTPEVFQSQLDALTSRMTKLLIYNFGAHDDNANAAMIAAEPDYMSYEQAVAALSGETASEAGTTGKTDALPFTETQDFTFMSGAGGWSTVLTIHPDGSFSGNYFDSDMGDSGDGYDATQYVSTFHGTFKNIQQKDDHTYVMQIDTLETEETQSEWIEETEYGRVRYVASAPYGLDGGTNFELYLPETAVSSLPSEYVDWVRMPMMLDEGAATLPGYGFYNVEEKDGFFGDWSN